MLDAIDCQVIPSVVRSSGKTPLTGEITLTENHIKQSHRDLLQYSEKDAYHRGNYEIQPNNVVGFDEAGKQVGIVFETATLLDTPPRMSELVAKTAMEG